MYGVKPEIIEQGTHKGFNWTIGTNTLGAFVAYIDVELTLLKGIHYDNIEGIDVHGGLTFSGEGSDLALKLDSNWFIGWDYAHCDDFVPMMAFGLNGSKVWTKEEILEQDVIPAIEAIVENRFSVAEREFESEFEEESE